MRLNKNFDRVTEAISLAVEEAEDYGCTEIKELLILILNFYLDDKEEQFHRFFMRIVEKIQENENF